MKLFRQAVGMLCILCISIAAGSTRLSLDPNNAEAGLLESHRRHKRQTGDQLKRCRGIILDEECNNGPIQALADLSLQCGLPSVASAAQQDCRRNSNGDYCGLADIYIEEVDRIGPACKTSLTSSCTMPCKNMLSQIRDKLGCCINLVYNTSTNSLGLNKAAAFNNALWTKCEVEPVTEECTSSTIRLREMDPDPTCDFATDFIELECARKFVEPLVDALTEEGDCQPYSEAAMEACGVNESGERCEVLSLIDQFVSTQDACNITDSSIGECRQALTNFRDAGGCCINNLFNGSLAGIVTPRYEFLSFEFWSNCNVETVGVCEPKLNGATYLKAPGMATLLMMMLATYLAV